MATYAGTPWEGKPFEYRSDIPLDLVAKGLAYKQGKTDEARQTIQGYLDSLGSNQFYRDSDRQLVNQKIQETVNSLNNYAGADLTDGRTQAQLMTTVSGLSNDPDVLNRIMANKNVSKQLNKIQNLKDHHPDQYSAINEEYFTKQLNKWREDPNQVNFDVTYKPYVDTNKWQQEAAEAIAKNPDIRNEILYTTVNGVKVPRTDREIKEVTLEKIYKGLLGQMPANVRGQFELEYKNALWDNGKKVALSTIENSIEDLQARADNLAQHMATHSFEPGAAQEAENKLALYNDKIKDLRKAHSEVSFDQRNPEEFVPLSDFLSEKVMSTAKAFAYRQEKDTDDPWGMAFQKHLWDQDDIRLTAKLRPKKGEEEDVPRTTNLAKHFNEMFTRGKAALSMDEYTALNNIDSKVDEDGYANKTFTGDDIFIDIRPMIQQVAGVQNVKQAAGQSALLDMYNIYKQKWALGSMPQLPVKVDKDGYSWEMAPHSGPTMHSNGSVSTPVMATYDQYVASLKNDPKLVDMFKGTYEIDLTDPNAIKVANDVAKVVNQHQISNVGTVITNVHGDAKVAIASGDNAFVGSDGLLYTAGVIKGTQRELEAMLGPDRFKALRNTPGKDGAPLLRESGAKLIGTVKGEGKYEPMYSMDAITKPKIDATVAYDKYLSKYLGSSDYKDNAATLNKQFEAEWQNNMLARNMESIPLTEYKVAADSISTWAPDKAAAVNELLNRVDNPKYSRQQQTDARVGILQLHELYQPKKK